MTKLFFSIWLGFFAGCLTILIGLIKFLRAETLMFRACVSFLLFLGIGAAASYIIYYRYNEPLDESSGNCHKTPETDNSASN